MGIHSDQGRWEGLALRVVGLQNSGSLGAGANPGCTVETNGTKMNRAITATGTKHMPISSPSARKPRRRCEVPLSASKPAEHQGGRVRTWLKNNVGLTSIAFGWAFAFASMAIPKTADFATVIIEVGIAGAVLFGFGIGWIVHEEIDGR